MVLTYVWMCLLCAGPAIDFPQLSRPLPGTGRLQVFSPGAPALPRRSMMDSMSWRRPWCNDRPNLGNPAAPLTAVGIDGTQLGLTNTPGTFFGPNIQDCLNGAPTCVATPASSFHFLIPASGLGNIGRNTFISPGFQTYNLTVQRSFSYPCTTCSDSKF